MAGSRMLTKRRESCVPKTRSLLGLGVHRAFSATHPLPTRLVHAMAASEARLAQLETRVAELEAGKLASSSADVWWLVSNGLVVRLRRCTPLAIFFPERAETRAPLASRLSSAPLGRAAGARQVFFMQCGFGMLEAGSVTARATQNILLKNLLDTSISAVVWYSLGFGVAFDGGNPFIGVAGEPARTNASTSTTLFLSFRMQVDDAAGHTTDGSAIGYNWAFWWFQFVRRHRPTPLPDATAGRQARCRQTRRPPPLPLPLPPALSSSERCPLAAQTFAAAAATIVSGAVAERAQLISYLVYSTTITLFIYPVVAHWAWSGAGFLSVANADAFYGGVVDFAGSGVVHMTGGVAALCGATVIGPRQGRFIKTPEQSESRADAGRSTLFPTRERHAMAVARRNDTGLR